METKVRSLRSPGVAYAPPRLRSSIPQSVLGCPLPVCEKTPHTGEDTPPRPSPPFKNPLLRPKATAGAGSPSPPASPPPHHTCEPPPTFTGLPTPPFGGFPSRLTKNTHKPTPVYHTPQKRGLPQIAPDPPQSRFWSSSRLFCGLAYESGYRRAKKRAQRAEKRGLPGNTLVWLVGVACCGGPVGRPALGPFMRLWHSPQEQQSADSLWGFWQRRATRSRSRTVRRRVETPFALKATSMPTPLRSTSTPSSSYPLKNPVQVRVEPNPPFGDHRRVGEHQTSLGKS
jgi:hypothetical protein